MKSLAAPRRRQIMAFLRAYVGEHGYAPSLREIGEALGTNLSITSGHVRALERTGKIKVTPNISRGIVILEKVA